MSGSMKCWLSILICQPLLRCLLVRQIKTRSTNSSFTSSYSTKFDPNFNEPISICQIINLNRIRTISRSSRPKPNNKQGIKEIRILSKAPVTKSSKSSCLKSKCFSNSNNSNNSNRDRLSNNPKRGSNSRPPPKIRKIIQRFAHPNP